MTGTPNPGEITPVRLPGIGVDDGLPVAQKSPVQQDPIQKVAPSSVLEPGTNAHAKSEQGDAAIDGAQGQDKQVDEKNEDDAGNNQHSMDDKPYSVFTHNEKRIIILCAGLSQFFSPISGQIYFPSLNAIAADLHVSNSQVTLTITTYLVRAFVRSRLKVNY
jgi:hypothetical protein